VLILGVDRFVNPPRAMLNVIGNSLGASRMASQRSSMVWAAAFHRTDLSLEKAFSILLGIAIIGGTPAGALPTAVSRAVAALEGPRAFAALEDRVATGP
jgi:hypothetical protein